MLLLLAPAVLAKVNATIISETTAPGCTDYGYCHALHVKIDNSDAKKSLVYRVPGANASTVYTISFSYKVLVGKFTVAVDGVDKKELNDVTWKAYNYTFTTKSSSSPVPVKIAFRSDSAAEFLIDELQMTPSPEATKFNNFEYDTGCCPWDYCWTGGLSEDDPRCIHDDFYEKNASMPPIGWDLADFGASAIDPATMLDAPSGYRCINGTWQYARAKISPLYDAAGFCPLESQCFLGGGSGKVEEVCVENGTFHGYRGKDGVKSSLPIEYFYCYEGNWTTRTKDIALQLLSFTKDTDTYTLFCDKYANTLNSDFNLSYYRDYIGDNVLSIVSSDTVEEFCILDLNGKIYAGVSMNVSINDTSQGGGCAWSIGCFDSESCKSAGCSKTLPKSEKSFIEVLKGPKNKDYCKGAFINDSQYHVCSGKDVYYNHGTKSVIFARTTPQIQELPIAVQKTFLQAVFDRLVLLFRNLLGIGGLAQPQTGLTQASDLSFIRKAGSFDKLYISHYPSGPFGSPRDIRAVRETRYYKPTGKSAAYRTFLNAEYFNYPVDICNFFYWDMTGETRGQISDKSVDNIQCTPVITGKDTWLYSIYVEEPLFEVIPPELWGVRVWKGASDNFWNDITAKIRTQATKKLSGSAPDKPAIALDKKNVVAGTVVNFSMVSNEKAGETLIARTWEFGDGFNASSAFNITTLHAYSEATQKDKPYKVRLCVMNNNYRIACSDENNLVVGLPLAVSFVEAQTVDQTLGITLSITGGNGPFGIVVDWGDGTVDDTYGSATTALPSKSFPLLLTHKYSTDSFDSTSNTKKFIVKVEGTDMDGADIDYKKEIVVKKSVSS
jgi:hypothetical protein